ncbi:hypothetical protein N7519_011370 [Penicillium mononematosum]|uniref:uncharacterized protein n=1 Tax=Penicillium mononematosum TaxID=268346 RepID=UPI00254963ED|nr:uncharacterized protein N7519_011370 [Penicillium mononematosum]KAJ6180909.1 hypothetical protein N7519_011370 [Penicillium mononematosum]
MCWQIRFPALHKKQIAPLLSTAKQLQLQLQLQRRRRRRRQKPLQQLHPPNARHALHALHAQHRQATVQDWTSFKLEWTEKSKKPKNPESYVLTPSFDSPTILTITGDQHVYEQFTVYLVNTLLGKTSDIPSSLSLGEDDCGKDANECMKKGWSHGTFKIPEGQQTILISWENSGRRPDVQQTWNHGTGQYRFDKAVPCEQENDEQKNQEKLKAMGK